MIAVTDDDHFHDECGVFAVYGAEEAANLAYLGLHALQHRGQESAGIVTSDGKQLFVHRGLGLVQEVFNEATLSRLPGSAAIGHVRYSTRGGSHLKNAQPVAVDYGYGSVAVAHNGTLTNADELRESLEATGSIFGTKTDTEVVVHLLARSKGKSHVDRVADALRSVEGAYSMVLSTPDQIIAVRDPSGVRPLCIGELRDGFVVASEAPAFHLVGGKFMRDVDPGEMVVIDAEGLRSFRPFEPKPPHMCIFEYVYFARPDATIDGVSVYTARKRLGHVLAQEQPVDADVVIPVPDSGRAAALGFSEATGIAYEMGLIRSHYVGRTFIEPQQSIRHFGVRLKLHPVAEVLRDKRIVVVDDSIVRGTTSRKIVKMLRDSGAREVHMRISSPPTRWPCFYGIDTPSREELIAANQEPEDIAAYLQADSVGYLSIEGLHRAVAGSASQNPPRERGYCDACFSGEYPIPLPAKSNNKRRQLPLVGL